MDVLNQRQNDILKVVVGLFNAAPGKNYLTDFVTQVANGTTIAQLADGLAAHSYFTEGIMGGKLTTGTQVAVLMDNFGIHESSNTSSAGFQANAFFTDRIDAGAGFGAIVLEAVTFLNKVSSSVSPKFSEIATLFANKVLIAEAYSSTNSSGDLSVLQNIVKNVTGTAPYTPADVTAFIASINDTTNGSVGGGGGSGDGSGDGSGSSVGRSFDLTTGNDNFVGTNRDDIFNGTYDGGVVTDTFNATDIITGNGGFDTLNISHLIDVAITPPDDLWTGITGIEKVVINTTGNGAQTITTGANFDEAFSTNGVEFTTTTIGSGAIDITMDSFTGTAAITTESLAGAQTILTGSAATSVKATSTGGALDIKGLGLTSVTALTTGAGAQTIGGAGINEGENLTTVNATAHSGAQTIISTSTNDVTVNATTGTGALIIKTGAGDDIITLTSTDSAGTATITGNAGRDVITLTTGEFSASATVVIGKGDSGITLSTADSIINFTTGEDFLKLGLAGDATAGAGNFVEADGAVADFSAALIAANTALETLKDSSDATQFYSFQWDDSSGYLFIDYGDGIADQVVELVGITGSTFAATDIIA